MVTAGSPKQFAFGEISPMLQSNYVDVLTGMIDKRPTSIYADSKTNSMYSKSSPYNRLNRTLNEEKDRKMYTEQSKKTTNFYDFVNGSVINNENKKSSLTFIDYSILLTFLMIIFIMNYIFLSSLKSKF